MTMTIFTWKQCTVFFCFFVKGVRDYKQFLGSTMRPKHLIEAIITTQSTVKDEIVDKPKEEEEKIKLDQEVE